MNTILFCSDLTSHTESALNFSIEIAKKSYSRILVFHDYYIPIPAPPSYQLTVTNMDETEQELKNSLDAICKRIRSNSYINNTPIVSNSMLSFNIGTLNLLNEINREKVDLIIMGARNAKGIVKLFGTLTTEIAENADSPVLIVPENTSFNGFKNILCAADISNIEIQNEIKEINNFTKWFNSAITFLLVSTSSEKKANMEAARIFKQNIINNIQNKNISFDVVINDNIPSALATYVKGRRMDLLLLQRRHRSIISSLINKSITRKMIFPAEFPVMVVPDTL